MLTQSRLTLSSSHRHLQLLQLTNYVLYSQLMDYRRQSCLTVARSLPPWGSRSSYSTMGFNIYAQTLTTRLSNGLAEQAVQTIKIGVKKLNGPLKVRLARFLFKYRVTPQATTGIAPVEPTDGETTVNSSISPVSNCA